MCKEAKDGPSRAGRERFEASRDFIRDEYEKLESIKIDSTTLSELAFANYNRLAKDLYLWSAPIAFRNV